MNDRLFTIFYFICILIIYFLYNPFILLIIIYLVKITIISYYQRIW